MLCTWNFRNHRAATGSYGNMVSGNFLTVNFNRLVVNEFGEAFNELNAIALETTMVASVNALNVGFTVFHHSRPVEAFLLQIKTIRR